WPTADALPSGIAVGADGTVYMAALRGESKEGCGVARSPIKGAWVKGGLRGGSQPHQGSLRAGARATPQPDETSGDVRRRRVW
ncbi:MAG: hypothetical protein ACYCV4_10710, partial [Dermatophilaceae bacterium]